MDLISLLITIIGIIALLGLYVMSKAYSQTSPANKKNTISHYTDAEGNRLSSVLADIPATDGSTPVIQSEESKSDGRQKQKDVQLVLFISAKYSEGLDGNRILQAMEDLDMEFGEMSIFHYLLDSGESLFRVANGVKPWTLIPDEMKNIHTPGLSLILQTPTPIDDHEALALFIDTAEKLAKSIQGELKNMQQQDFTHNDKEKMRDMI